MHGNWMKILSKRTNFDIWHYLRNNSRGPDFMIILTWVGIIFVIILHRVIARCKILTNIMPTHVKISIDTGIREIFRF